MPTKEDFKLRATNCNGTPKFWRQTSITKHHTFGKSGICSPLVYQWLVHRKQNRFNEEQRRFPAFIGGLAEESQLNDLFELKYDQHTNPANYSQYLAMCGFREQVRRTFPTPDYLATFLCEGAGYFDITISNDGGGAELSSHALGFDSMSSKKVVFFDPNLGQVAFKRDNNLFKADFRRYFPMHMQNYPELLGEATAIRYV